MLGWFEGQCDREDQSQGFHKLFAYGCPDRGREFDRRRDKELLKRLYNIYVQLILTPPLKVTEISINCGNADQS